MVAVIVTVTTTVIVTSIYHKQKEKKEVEKICYEIKKADRERLEKNEEIERKYDSIRNELKIKIDLLHQLPKDSRLYKETLEEVSSALGLSTQYVEFKLNEEHQ